MCDLLRTCVEAHQRRNDDLIENYEQLMRISPSSPLRPNRQNCDLIDNIVFEHFLTLFSTVRAARSQRPYWLMEPLSPEDDESAQRVERGLTHRVSNDGFDAALYDADWITLRDAVAPMFIGWSDRQRNRRSLRYRPSEAEEGSPEYETLITAEEKEAGVEYDEVPFVEPQTFRNGFDFEVYDRANWYMMEPEAKDIDDCLGCGPRKFWTAEKLVEGIQRYNLDEDVVHELLRLGPTIVNEQGDYQESKREVSGTEYVQKREQGIGYYELFFWFGKLPIWTKNGGLEVPDYLLNDEFMWIICPAYDKVLRFSYSPFNMRPFTLFRMLREPNGQGGESVPTITGAYQDEGTAILRAGIDSANIRTIPMIKRLASNDERFGTQTIQPGGTFLCERSLNEMELMQYPGNAVQETLLWLTDTRSRAQRVMSAEGFGNLQPKQRRAAEINAAMAGVNLKQSLFVGNIQESGMRRAAEICLSHIVQFGGSDPYAVFQRGIKTVEVQPDDWKKVYNIRPRGTAQDADPAARQQRSLAETQLVRSSPLYQQQIQTGDMRAEYHLMRSAGFALNENFNIESYFGPEPPPPNYLQITAQVFGAMFEQLSGLPGTAQQAAGMFMQSPQMRQVFAALLQQQGAAGPGMEEEGAQEGPMQMMTPQAGSALQMPSQATVTAGRNGAQG